MKGPLDTVKSRADADLVNIIIDTQKGSRNKFKYDEENHIIKLSRVLPAGFSFPYDFGSIPRTLAEDGDALDVIVINDTPSFPGCLITGKLIGTISGEQTEKKATIRNDRLIAVPVTDVNPPIFIHIDDLPNAMVKEIVNFFVSYNQAQGREYKLLKLGGPKDAEAALIAANRKYKHAHKL